MEIELQKGCRANHFPRLTQDEQKQVWFFSPVNHSPLWKEVTCRRIPSHYFFLLHENKTAMQVFDCCTFDWKQGNKMTMFIASLSHHYIDLFWGKMETRLTGNKQPCWCTVCAALLVPCSKAWQGCHPVTSLGQCQALLLTMLSRVPIRISHWTPVW